MMSDPCNQTRYQQWKKQQKSTKLEEEIQKKKEELKRVTEEVEKRQQIVAMVAKEQEQWRQVTEDQHKRFQEEKRKFIEAQVKWKNQIEEVKKGAAREEWKAEEERRTTNLLGLRLNQQSKQLQSQSREISQLQQSMAVLQEERRRLEVLQQTIKRLEQSIQEQKKEIRDLEVGKQALLQTSTEVQKQLLHETTVLAQEQQRWTQQVDSLQTKLKEYEDLGCKEKEEEDMDQDVGFEEFEIEEDEEEVENNEEEEYGERMVKLGMYLLQLLEESKKAIDIGRNRSTPHVEVLLSLWSVLPYRFVEEHLQVSKTTLSKYRKKRIATNTPHGTIPGSGAPSEGRTKKKKQHWIHFDQEDLAEGEGLFHLTHKDQSSKLTLLQPARFYPVNYRKNPEPAPGRNRVRLPAEPLLKEAQEFYFQEGFSTKVGWVDPSSTNKDIIYSLIGKARRTRIYQAYLEEKGTQPRVSKTTFLSLTPTNWVEPSMEKCVCSYCHEGLEILDSLDRLLSVGLPDNIRQSRRGWGAHIPRASHTEDTINYLEAQKLIALLRHHLGEEVIEKARRSQHPITSRIENERTSNRAKANQLSFEGKDKPSHLCASATRGIPLEKYHEGLLHQLNKPNQLQDGSVGETVTSTQKRGNGRRKKGEEAEKKKKKKDEPNYLPPQDQYSFTKSSGCEHCDSIERLFQIVHSLIPRFQNISKKTWVTTLHMSPPDTESQAQETFLKAICYSWAYGIEKWRDHLCIAGSQLRNFDEDIKSLTPGTEVWLMDFAMTYSLVQTAKETQSQFFDKKYANDLGVIRYILEPDGQISRTYNDWMSTDKVKK
jgi:hypothetical protein